jgi:hypothetical protein
MARMSSVKQTDTFLLDEVPELRAAREALSRYIEAMPSRKAVGARASIQEVDYSGPHARVTWIEYVGE